MVASRVTLPATGPPPLTALRQRAARAGGRRLAVMAGPGW
jgi:hypothetical protein